MAICSPYEHFIDRICQLDFEDRLVAGRLASYEKSATVIAFLVALFAPGSAVGSGLAELSLGPTLQGVVGIAWRVMIWVASVLVVVGAFFVAPKVKALRSVKEKLDGFSHQFSVVLDEVHYQDANGSEWISAARKATETYSTFSFDEDFSDEEREAAWASTIEAYAQYLGRSDDREKTGREENQRATAESAAGDQTSSTGEQA